MSHKENPKLLMMMMSYVEEKKDNNKDDDKKKDNENNDNNDHIDHTLVGTQATGSIAGMSRRRGKIRKHLKTAFITNEYFQEKMREIPDLLKNLVSKLIVAKTNEITKEAVLRLANLQDQAADTELWKILKAKFEKS
nr:hypothetical protein [Tanacetum cinerariifolium]